MIGQIWYGSLDLTDFPYITDPESDLGAPSAEVATVSRLLADGDVVAGVRSGNRTLQLRVTIASDSREEFAAAEAALFAEVDKATNTLTVLFGAGDGLPVVADTYRGQITPTYDADVEYDYIRSYVLSCAAEPFFRSPEPITIAPSTTSTQIDALESTTGLTCSSTPTVDTTTFVRGTGSIKQDLTLTQSGYLTEISASWSRAISSLDLHLAATVIVWLLADVPFPLGSGTLLETTLTLSSSGGKSTTWVASIPPGSSGWTKLIFNLLGKPAGTTGGGVDLSAVTGWSLTFDNNVSTVIELTGTYHVWADDLRAYPHGAAETTAGSAQLYFQDVEGAARTPVSIEVDTTASGGLLLANTPNPPPGYDPVLLAVTGSPPGSIVATRKAVTLRREAPECSTYVVMLYSHISAGAYQATATDSSDPSAIVSTCSRTITTSDPEYRRRNSAGYALFALGELTLPPTDVDPQNTASTVTITITGAGSLNGAWLLWSGGENIAAFPPAQITNWYLDALTPGQQAGKLVGNNAAGGRAASYDMSSSRMGQAVLNFEPGPNHLLAVALPPAGAPTTNPTFSALLTYFSRWLSERTS